MGSYEDILVEIGFSKAESIVYVILLKTGPTKSGNIIKLSSLQSSVVHNALNTLANKGFVKYILEGKIKKSAHLEALKIEMKCRKNPKLLKKILDEELKKANDFEK